MAHASAAEIDFSVSGSIFDEGRLVGGNLMSPAPMRATI
jgi:hypothetical protein